MINFRFHIVSLIAVFLALGLGILVGSSVVDRVIVDRLDDEIKSVRHESSLRNEENDRLRDEMSKLDDALRGSTAFAVDGRLDEVPVVVIAERGTDTDVVKETTAMLRAAGAEVPGAVWLDDRWRLDKPEDLPALHEAADVTGNQAAARLAALRLLINRMTDPLPRGRTRTTDVLTSLRDDGFIEVSEGKIADFEDFPSDDARVLVLTGTDSHLTGTETLVDVLRAVSGAKVDTVVAEAYNDHDGAEPVPQRGAALAPVRGDNALNESVSTLDDAELVQGQVAAVLALEQIADGAVGHYGYGDGVSSPLPPPISS